MESHSVKVYIYDMSQGMTRAMSRAFIGKQIDGIWHTGIVAYGREYFFGGSEGIMNCQPGGTILGQPTRIHDLGETQIPYEMFMDYLHDLSQSTFRPECYHLLDHNCNTFSSEVAQFLTGNDIPPEITSLPADVLSTPFGQMIRPFIDAMSVSPGGGHSVFPSGSPPTQISSQQQDKSSPATSNGPAYYGASPGQCKSPKAGETTLTPHVCKMEMPEASIWKSSSMALSSSEQGHIAEIYEFLSQNAGTWSLGRDHMTTLQKLALGLDTSAANHALQILSNLVQKEDIVQIWSHDPKSKFSEILNCFDSLPEETKVYTIKMLTNCCSLECGHKLLTEKHQEQTTSVCVSCLLSGETNLVEPALGLSYNLTIRKISEDMALALGSATLNCAGGDFSEESAFHLLSTVLQLMQSSDEVKGLAAVLGVDFDRFRGKSAKNDELCDKISKLL